MHDDASFTDLFPIKKHWAYFRTASDGPLSMQACEAVRYFSNKAMTDGNLLFEERIKLEADTRKYLGQLIGCESSNIAFTNSTGDGLWIASRLVPLAADDEIIVPRGEFPSNVYPWITLEPMGVKVHWLEPTDSAGSVKEIDLDSLSRLVNERTKIISLSWVQYDNGCRRNINQIGKFCKDKGIVFCIDAIQGMGVIPFDIKDCQADFVASGIGKWLFSGVGLGFLYVAPQWLTPSDRVPNMNWYGMSDPFNFKVQSHAESLERLDKSARRFEQSCANFLALAALRANLELIASYGIEKIAGRVKSLTDKFVDGLTAIGCSVLSPRHESAWSGIVAFSVPSIDLIKLQERFIANKVLATVKPDIVRAAIHFFNDESEIDKMLSVIKEEKNRQGKQPFALPSA